MSGMPGLVVGPDDTFYGELRQVPLHGWEVRITAGSEWRPRTALDPWSQRAIVQARRVLAPDPNGIWWPGQITTTWGEMRDRSDLDEWEYANVGPYVSGWNTCTEIARDTRVDFPLTVRRRAS